MKTRFLKCILYAALPLLLFGFSDKKKMNGHAGNKKAAQYTVVFEGENYSSPRPYNLNVVYFLPKDIPLDPTYKKRVSGLLLYGQGFYKQNMINNGYGPKTFGLFTKTASPDSVLIVLVRGEENISEYPSGNSKQIAEVNAFYAANPSLNGSEHTLILTATTGAPNVSVPYYGGNKLCYATDFPNYDIQYLNATGPEGIGHALGGMLHELGHGLNLLHSHQTNSENADPNKGMNLLYNGNGTLGTAPTFINRADAAVLNNSQTFADAPGMDYYNGHTAGLTSVHAVYDNGDIVVSGTFQSDKPVTDVNIYQDPFATPGLNDGYFRVAWSVSPTGNSFSIRMPVSEMPLGVSPYPATGAFTLQIELVLQNGETNVDFYGFSYKNSIPAIDIDFDDSAPCDALPAVWQLANIGTAPMPGTVCYTEANKNFRLQSYGSGLGGTDDELPFVYQAMAGDGQIVGKLKLVSTAVNNTGLMIRTSLSPNSAYIFSSPIADFYRDTDGGSASSHPLALSPLPPVWLKLERRGMAITSYYSADSILWTASNSYFLPAAGETIYIGIAASANGNINNINHVTVSPLPVLACAGGSANGCPAYDTVPGKAINFFEYSFLKVPVTVAPTNTFTITGWVKPKGILPAQSSLLAWDNGYFYLGQNNDNQLGYVWGSEDVSNTWSSGLFAPADEWSFMAMVIHPDSATLYLNGRMATNATPHGLSAVLNATLGDSFYGSGYFLGQMDEVSVWKRALSTDEIDSLRHLTKEKIADKVFASYDPSLVSYFQFNDTLSNGAYNQVDSAKFSFSGGTNKVNSTAPVGGGVSSRHFINDNQEYAFGNTGVVMAFANTGTYPNGNVWATKINQLPTQYPHASVLSTAYWIIDNYGANSEFTRIETLKINNAATLPATTTAPFNLYKRAANAYGYTWADKINGAATTATGQPYSITFASPAITSEGQLFLNSGIVEPRQDTIAGKMLDLTPPGNPAITLSPIPINNNAFTITMWVKPHGLQAFLSQLISTNAPNTRFGIGFGYAGQNGNLNLMFSSPSTDFWLKTDIDLVSDEWNHIALTYSLDSVSIFLNGGAPWTLAKASSNTPHGFPVIDFSQAPVTINSDLYGSGGNYKGQADEVCFYDYTLSQQQIREQMHLTKNPLLEKGLVGYYQFNQYDGATQTLYDALGDGTPSALDQTNIAVSTSPVASGTSFRIAHVNAAGTYDFTGTGATLTFPGPIVPGGEMVVSRLNSQPDSLPGSYTPIAKPYWIIHNWGANAVFTPATAMRFDGLNISAANAATAGGLVMLKRQSNGFINNWVPMCTNAAATAGASGSVTFDGSCGNSSFSQFLIASASVVLPVKLVRFTGQKQQNAVLLEWDAEQEINLARYELQRSSDGITYLPIGSIMATGKSRYSFIDKQPLMAGNYYRLRLVDNDGRLSFSGVVLLGFGKDGFVRLLPNPVYKGQVLRIQNMSDAKATVNLYLADGRLQRSLEVPANREVQVSGLPKGALIYKATDAQGKKADGIIMVL